MVSNVSSGAGILYIYASALNICCSMTSRGSFHVLLSIALLFYIALASYTTHDTCALYLIDKRKLYAAPITSARLQGQAPSR